MTNAQRIRRVTVGLLAGMILALAIGFFAANKQDFSENENRYLAKLPSPGWEDIKSGAYMQGLSDYASDHFLFRDFFIGLKTKAETALGRKEINGVYIAEDGYLIEAYKSAENTERIAGILKSFAQELEGQEAETQETEAQETEGQEPRLRLMLIPTAVYVYEDRLPAHVQTKNQMETAEAVYRAAGIVPIDCSQALLEQKNGEPLYYRTDHHWTTRGAYEGYRVFCENMGFEAVPLTEMAAETVTEDFRGTIYSKTGDYSRKGDSITIYTNPADRLTVSYLDTGEVTDSLYNLEYTEKKDKYSLFLDNLHSLIEITNETAGSDRELALIKDSYANSMVPFLAHHYKKIYVFDTRYYKQGPSAFIKEHPGITDVLILYNMNTLDSDLGIRGIY